MKNARPKTIALLCPDVRPQACLTRNGFARTITVRRSRFVRRQAQSSQPKSPCEFDTRTSLKSRRSCELRDRRPRIPSLDEPLVKQQRRRSGNDLRETQHASAFQAPFEGPVGAARTGLIRAPAEPVKRFVSHNFYPQPTAFLGVFCALFRYHQRHRDDPNLARNLGVFKMLFRHRAIAGAAIRSPRATARAPGP